jgi:hypothetical protein
LAHGDLLFQLATSGIPRIRASRRAAMALMIA